MTPNPTRRLFLGGALAVAGATITKAMPYDMLLPRIVGDGIHNDTAGLQAAFDGEPFVCDGCVVSNAGCVDVGAGTYRVTGTLFIRRQTFVLMHDCELRADHDETVIHVTEQSVADITNINLNRRRGDGQWWDIANLQKL